MVARTRRLRRKATRTMNDEEMGAAPPARLDVPVCRALSARVELRADEGDDGNGEPGSPGTLVGHFSRFNNWYEINSFFEGQFLERIAPGAFKKTLRERKDGGETPIRVLLEHGFDPTVGDKPLGVPRVLQEDAEGPYAEVPLFDTSYNRDLAPALRAGAYGQSFRFHVLVDEWVEPEAKGWVDTGDPRHADLPQRTIKEVRVSEFGPTVFPANPAAEAGLRSTTDDYYQRLRRRDPAQYDEALARTQAIRTPSQPPKEPPVDTTVPDEPVEQRAATAVPEEPREHSEATTSTNQNRSTNMDESMTVEERAARQTEIRARFSEIDTEYAGAALPEEAQAEWNSLQIEMEEHETAIAAAEARRRYLAELAGTQEGETSGQPRNSGRRGDTGPAVIRRPENIYDLAAIRQQARSMDELAGLYRDNAMRAVEQARFPGVRNREAAQAQVGHILDKVDDDQGTLARRVLVTGSPTYDRAFGKACSMLSTNGLTTEEQRALSLGTDTAGGFAVPFQLDPTIILTSDGVVDPLRQISRVVQIVGKEWQGITSAGVTVSRSAEGAEVGDQTPTLAQPTVKAERVTGFVPFSMEIESDWTQMRAEISALLADAKATEEADSFVNGDGTGVNASGVVGTLGAGSNVDTAAVNAYASDDLYALEEALPPRFRANATFLANRSVYNATRQLGSASDGGDLWVRLASGLPPELIGYPAREASEMPAFATATGTKLLLLGDFRHFLIVDRVGMTVELVPHLFATANNRPSGQRGLLAVWRNNSKILTDAAFRLLVVDGV